MQFLPISDPHSFAIPTISSSLIFITMLVLLSTKWMNSEPVTVKVPQHISARLVQVKKSSPKKVIKKTTKTKKVVKKASPKVKAKKVVVNKKAQPKKEVIKPVKAIKKPKPVALPDSNLFEALEEEEYQADLAKLLSDEINAQQADKEQKAVISYSAKIKQLVESVWRTPPSAKHDDSVTIRVYLVPTGEVTEVQLVESSGNKALDRSAIQAVWRVAQFPVPDDSVIFEKNFRKITLSLIPSNARL